MKRMLSMLLAASLVAAPAMAVPAAAPADADEDGEISLLEAADRVAREVAAEEAGVETLAVQEERETNTTKLAVGIALIAGGAGIIANGAALWQDEPDRFDRTKNADSYMSFGVGSVIALFGVLATRSALRGEGWY